MPRTSCRRCLLVSGLGHALVAAAAGRAHAQTAPDTARRPSTLDPVVVTGTRAAPRPSTVTLDPRGLPTPVTVLTHDEIDRTNFVRDAGDLFRRVPGVIAHNLGQGSTGTSIKLRGFLTATHGADVAVYIDGMPQNVPSSAINHGMNDMTWLTPDMIERIEVIQGPFSALYGDQNRAGAVNIVTRATAPTSVGGEVASYGTGRASAVVSGAAGRVRSLVVGDLLSTDGYRANSDEGRGTLFLKESAVLGRSLVAVRGVYHRDRWNAPGFLNFTGLTNGPVRATDRDTTAPPLWGNAERTSVVLTHAPAAGENGVRATAYAEGYKRTRALGANRTDLNVQSDDRRVRGARALENVTLGGRAALAVGAEVRSDRGDAINRRWPNGVPGATYTFDQDLDLLTCGAFAQGQVRPLGWLKLIGGVRADRFRYDIDNRKLPAASVAYRGSVTTPRGGVVVTPFGALDLFADVGQGFRSPAQAELSPGGSLGPLGASGGTGYPDLAVPKVRSRDYGFRARPARGWEVSGARYHTLNDNEIAQTAPGVFASVGNTTRDGWELESALAATRALDLYASFARLDRARINTAAPGTADVLSLPRNTIKGGAAYTAAVGADRLLLNLDAEYFSPTPYFAGTPLVRMSSRQYARYDLRATYARGAVQLTTFAVVQPVEFSSEVVTSTAAGLLVDPRPRAQTGLQVRYFLGR